MQLLERHRERATLSGSAARARAGAGGLVLVAGESGAGKTSFVEDFLDSGADGARVLWGACDPLSTPRPLGPIHDLSAELGEGAREALHHGEHSYEIFDALFGDLNAVPSVLVIDDLHWADQGTVDLLRFVLRRVRRSTTLV